MYRELKGMVRACAFAVGALVATAIMLAAL